MKSRQPIVAAMKQRNLVIDFAVVCQELSKIDASPEQYHVIDLDEINISKEDFQSLFYAHGENFGISKSFAMLPSNIKYISFSKNYRTIHGQKFFLVDKIFEHLERDLNVTRDCFTPESRIDLTQELLGIETICDLDSRSVMSSLTWSNIEFIIEENTKIVSSDTIIQTYLIFNIIFRTPTEGTKDTLVKFIYKIE